MKINWRTSFLSALLFMYAGVCQAQGPAEPTAAMRSWLAATAHQKEAIAPGTRITARNWQQYQQYMPLGMIELFKGNHYWKMPADVEIDGARRKATRFPELT